MSSTGIKARRERVQQEYNRAKLELDKLNGYYVTVIEECGAILRNAGWKIDHDLRDADLNRHSGWVSPTCPVGPTRLDNALPEDFYWDMTINEWEAFLVANNISVPE